MEREKHLFFCKKCTNRKFSREKGIICGLTGEQADFEENCSGFVEDIVEAEKINKYQNYNGYHNDSVGGWIRFANFIIDRVVHLAIIFIISFIFAIANIEFIFNMDRVEEIVFELSLYVVYYIVMEFSFQTTVGKLITGTVVVNIDGSKPTLKVIVGRSFSRLVPFDALSFLGGGASGWHDSWSNTKVIKRRDMKKNVHFDEDILDQDLLSEF
ncbi:MAG: hypothetical protein COB15_06400 [Flavobacteriales bacterium]|nr:MAG: hypothetical protein COB15_06400 [Flavobacteriales bacterium]